MKTFLLTSAALVAFGAVSTASAADLAARPYTKAPPMIAASGYNWAGFYIGGHGGYGWARNNTTAVSGAGTTFVDTSLDGGFGGGQIGYNWVIAPNWLFGIEGDGSIADMGVTTSNTTGATTSVTNTKVDAFGTVRGRIGYFWNNVLLYGTGGYGWYGVERDRTITASGNPALIGQNSATSATASGWVVGGGLEWGFAPNWSAKTEYLYSEFNTASTFTYTLPGATVNTDTKSHLHTVKFGINYHFNAAGPILAKY